MPSRTPCWSARRSTSPRPTRSPAWWRRRRTPPGVPRRPPVPDSRGFPHACHAERLVPIAVADVPRALSVLEGHDVCDRHLDVDAASTATRIGVEERDDLVARVDEPFRLVTEPDPVLLQRHHVLPDPVAAADRLAT